VPGQSLINALIYCGDTPPMDVVRAHLGKFAPVQAEAAALVSEYERVLSTLVATNAEFTQARISDTECMEKQEYLKRLRLAADTYASLRALASDAVAKLSREHATLDEQFERANEHAALRQSERDQLRIQKDEEAALLTAHQAAPMRAPTPEMHAPMQAPMHAAEGALGAQHGALGAQHDADPPERKRLMDMGFSRDQACAALEAHANDLSKAVAALIGSADEDEDRTAGALAPMAPGTAPGAPAAAPVRLSTRSGTLTRNGSFRLAGSPRTALPPKVQQLVDMGFSKERAAKALAEADGHVDSATNALLSTFADPTGESPSAAPPAPAPSAAPPAPAPSAAPPTAPAASASRSFEELSRRSEADLEIAISASSGFEEQARELISMGFARTQVHMALRRSGGRLEAAAQMLLDAPDGQLPPDAPDGQRPPAASGAALGAGAPTAPQSRWLSDGPPAARVPVATQPPAPPSSVPRVLAPPRAPPAAVPAVAGTSTRGAVAGTAVPAVAAPPPPAEVRGASSAVSEEVLEHLVAMGFSRGQARVALKQTSNDVEAAINLLFDPTFQAQAAAAAASIDSPAAPVSAAVSAAPAAAPAAPAAPAVPVRPSGQSRTNSTGVAYVPPSLQRTPSAGVAAALAAAAAGGRFVFSPQPLGTHTYSPQLGDDATPITTPRGVESVGAELGRRAELGRCAELGTPRGGAWIDDSTPITTPRGAERYASVSSSSRAPPPAPPKSVSKAFTQPYRPPGGDLD